MKNVLITLWYQGGCQGFCDGNSNNEENDNFIVFEGPYEDLPTSFYIKKKL